MKTAIYIRVSTEDQAKEGYSLEVQREHLESFASREGYQVFKIYNDDGYSGYNTERPALKELVEDAKNKCFDLVLVYKLDRFSRNLKDLLNLVDNLSSFGINFKSATEPFDTTTSAGKLMFQQLGSFAEFERNRLKERIVPGMIKSVKEGNWLGARYAPFGYNYNKENKLLEINKEQAKLVKIIFLMCIEGKSVNSITKYLTRKGYRNRNGNIFSASLIRNILKNRVYEGKIVWNRHRYDKAKKTPKGHRYITNPDDKVIIAEGKHKPIISSEDFQLAQEQLKIRRIDIRKKPSAYPLSGILFCSKCNHKYLGHSAISNHRTQEKKRWYRCSGYQRSFISCKNKSVKAEDIEPKVAQILEILLKNDKLNTKRYVNMTDSDIQSFCMPESDILNIKSHLKRNLQKQSRLTDSYLDNLLNEDIFRQKQEGLRSEEEELKKHLALNEIKTIERERSKEYLDRAKQLFHDNNVNADNLDAFTKNQLLKLVFKNIKIADRNIFSFDFFAPFNFFYFEEHSKRSLPENYSRKRRLKTLKNQSTLRLSDDLWEKLYITLNNFFQYYE